MTKDKTATAKIEVTQEFIDGVEKVYCKVSGGVFRKSTTHSSNIIAVFEEKFIEKENLLEDLLKMVDECKKKNDMRKMLYKYFN